MLKDKGLQEKVSVPLRGLWFLSACWRWRYSRLNCQVSVPLRGLWFLSDNSIINVTFEYCFRPLAGIMVLIGDEELTLYQKDGKSFRPLAGIMVLIAQTR